MSKTPIRGKPFPRFKSDEEAEKFVATADLSEYDFSGFRPIGEFFEYLNKEARVNMRLPQRQLDAVKAAAKKRGMPYQRLIREAIDQHLRRLEKAE
jgi:predicted DNA binding CopG/RHH family protein